LLKKRPNSFEQRRKRKKNIFGKYNFGLGLSKLGGTFCYGEAERLISYFHEKSESFKEPV
jgi:hypothetical protein